VRPGPYARGEQPQGLVPIRHRIALIVTLTLILGGCGDDGSSIDDPTTTIGTAVAATSQPTATSTTTATAAPTTTSTTSPTTTTMLDPDRLVGDWLVTLAGVILTFDADGTHGVSYPSSIDEPFDHGTYTIEGNQITMLADEDSEGCGGEGPGVYNLVVADDGQSLDFTLISDECAERRDIEGRVVAYDR
jgi:hypothetical protein